MAGPEAALDIAVVGGGIGGLVTALSLHAIGRDVHVFEATEEVRPLGVGINLLPHAIRELDALGLLDALAAESVATTTLAYYIYSKAFTEFQLGYASAVSWVLFAMVFVVTMINWKIGNREVNY